MATVPAESSERGRDVDIIRQFLSGQGPIALLDLPWLPIYLAFIYFLHPLLALIVAGGALVLAALTLTTELLTRRLGQSAQEAATERADMLDSNVHNAEVLRALGLRSRLINRFEEANREHLAMQMRTSDLSGTFSGISKVLRMILQSAVLGLGAFLTINGDLSAGAIIAASVTAARALAPIDLAISQWKGLVLSRRSWNRLSDTLSSVDELDPSVPLPAASSNLKVENLTVTAPGSGLVVLSDVSLDLTAGQALGLIGPSGSGKSSFARGITGIWPLVRGHVRLDDADISQYEPDALGQQIGYLPQDVQLMRGSVAENISRFDPNADGRDVIAAAQIAGVHEMILRLPNGYEHQLGVRGAALSAGQRQRVALARAIYGHPFLVVLDEPNSNLDAEGEAALADAIRHMRDAGSIVVVIAHRPSALSAVDMVGILQAGRLIAFGPRDEILRKHVEQPVVRPVPQRPVQVAGGGSR